jgi:hypothetical protein
MLGCPGFGHVAHPVVEFNFRRWTWKGPGRMKPKANDIGQHINRLRHRRGLTQEQLAIKIQLKGQDMTRQIVANMESRRRTINDRQIVRLVLGLDCTLDELFFGIAGPPVTKHGPARPARKPPRR